MKATHENENEAGNKYVCFTEQAYSEALRNRGNESPRYLNPDNLRWTRRKKKSRLRSNAANSHSVMDPETFLQSSKSAILLAMHKALVRPKRRIAKLEAAIAQWENQPITYEQIQTYEQRVEKMKNSLDEANQKLRTQQGELDRLLKTEPSDPDRQLSPTYQRKKSSITAPKILDKTSALHIATLLQNWLKNGLKDAQCCKLLQIYLGQEEFLTPDGVYPGDTLHLLAKKFFSHHTRTLIELMEKSGSFTFLVTRDKKHCYGCFSNYRIDRKLLQGNSDVLRQSKHIQVAPRARMTTVEQPSIANFETEDKVYILLDSISHLDGLAEQLTHPTQPSAHTATENLSSEGLKKNASTTPLEAVVAVRRFSSEWETSPAETLPTECSKKITAPNDEVAENEKMHPSVATAETINTDTVTCDTTTSDTISTSNTDTCAETTSNVATTVETTSNIDAATKNTSDVVAATKNTSGAKRNRRKLTALPLLTTPAKVKAAQEREAIDYGSAEDFFRQLATTTPGRRFLDFIEKGLMKEFKVNAHQANLMMNYLVKEELIPYYNRLKKFHQAKQEARFIWLTRLVNNKYFSIMKKHAYETCHKQIRAIDAEKARRIVEQENLASQQQKQPTQQKEPPV